MPGLEGWRREALLAHRDDRRRAHRQARQPVPILASRTRVRVGSGARMDHGHDFAIFGGARTPAVQDEPSPLLSSGRVEEA